MTRIVLILSGAALAAGLAFAGASAQDAAPKGDVAHGKHIFTTYGCYQCHGYQGQGSASGPKLAPNPLPFDAVARQMRKPRGVMPVYTHKTVSDGDVADIYAYLQSMPKAKTVADIPMLSGLN
jgi:ubiquinol-cytochrome c reductase cytochrome c subunit